MSEVIVVTSGKGGVGKTTVAANLGCGLALLGNKVVLIDTDIGLRNLDVVMGLENRIVYNLVDVVEGGCRIKQALIKDKNHQGLYLMPSAQTRDKSSVTPQQMKKLTQELTEEFDYVILDTAPVGMVTDTLLIGRTADLSVYVCRADYTRKAEFTLVNELSENKKLPNLCVAINGLDLQKKKYGYYYGYGKYGKYYGYGKRYGYGYGYGEKHTGQE